MWLINTTHSPNVESVGVNGVRRADLAVVLIITAVGLALRIYRIGSSPLWFDEGMSLGCARLSWGDSLFLAMREPVQWPYYMVLRFFLLFGDSEALIRLPSTVFMTASIPMMYLVARRLFGNASGLFSAMLVALNADMVMYSQEARSYGMEIFLLLLSLYVLCGLVNQRTAWKEVEYISVCVLAVYTQMYAILIIGAQAISLLALPRGHVPIRLWIRMYVAVCALTIPMWVFASRIPRRETYFMPAPSGQYAYSVIEHLCGNRGPILVLLYGMGVLGAMGSAILTARAEGRSVQTWAMTLPIPWIALPFLISITVSYLGKPCFLERYMLGCVLGLALSLGTLVRTLRPPAMALVLAVLFASISLYGVRDYYGQGSDKTAQNYPALSGFVAERAEAGDAIMLYWPRMEILYSYYMNRLQPAAERPAVIYPIKGDTSILQILPPEQTPMSIQFNGYKRIWLVIDAGAEQRRDPEILTLTRSIEAHFFHVESLRELQRHTVVLYAR